LSFGLLLEPSPRTSDSTRGTVHLYLWLRWIGQPLLRRCSGSGASSDTSSNTSANAGPNASFYTSSNTSTNASANAGANAGPNTSSYTSEHEMPALVSSMLERK